MPKELEELNKAIADMGTFYTALRGLLLDLEALDDSRIKALFIKYDVLVQ